MSEARLNIEARLNRVQEHVAELDRRIGSFIKDESAYLIEPEQAPDRDEIWIHVTALRNPPLREWAPIFSDVVNGLRGSLDNIVWALSANHQRRLGNPPPRGRIPSGSQWRDVVFPVVIDQAHWNGRCVQCLWAIDPSLTNTFRDVQPFVTGKNQPEREPVAIAHELWNVNKHRHVSLSTVWTGGEETEIGVTPDPPFEQLKFRTVWVARRGVLKLKARTKVASVSPLFRVSAINAPASLSNIGFPVNVEHGIPFDIAFKRGYPGYGLLAIETLEAVHATACKLLETVRDRM